MSDTLAEQNSNQAKKAYTPDFGEFLSQCEVNYLMLSQLIPELFTKSTQDAEHGTQGNWFLSAQSLELKFLVVETARYTTTLDLFIQSPKIELLKTEKLIIRLYHDAQMLEVMEGSGPGALKAIYEQSSGSHKTVDEKRQVNRFIGECLRACHNAKRAKLANSAG